MNHGTLHRLPAPQLGRKMFVWTWGWSGAPVLVFPSASGMAHEWEKSGAVDALRPLINAGRLRLYCPETNVADCWTHATDHPASRLARHQAYEDWIVHDLVPWIRRDCGDPHARIAATGVSMGGWYTTNMALKHPEIFWWGLSLSGRFSVQQMLGDWWSDDLYYHLPLSYVPNLAGPELDRVRHQTRLTLVVGQGPFEGNCLPETVSLAESLMARGIPCERDVWGRDVSHEWTWWRRQLILHLGRRFG